MRVVVHFPSRTEPDGTEVPESVAAYKQGRIQPFDNPVTGETHTPEEVAESYVKQAEEEFPGLEVKIERLEMDDTSSEDPANHTAKWVPVDEFNPENAAGAGNAKAQVLSAEQTTEAN